MSVNLRARQTSRENKVLTHRTFQEEKKIWEDHSYQWNSNYWLGINPLAHIPKITFKFTFRTFGHIHVMQQRHTLYTEDVTMTKTGWCMRRPDFYRFLSDFTWSSQLKTIAHCLLLNCIKQGILIKMSFHVIVLHKCTFREKSPMCEGCTPLFNRVRRHLASQCFEIDNLDALPVYLNAKKMLKMELMHLFLC